MRYQFLRFPDGKDSAVRLEHLLVLAGQFSLKLCQTP